MTAPALSTEVIDAELGARVSEAARRLANSLIDYWPCLHHEERSNGVPECNAVGRLATALELADYRIYPEAACHAGAGRKLDLLAYRPKLDLQLRVQAKRLFTRQQEGSSMLGDVEIIDSFIPNLPGNPQSALPRARNVAGLLLGITHCSVNPPWWMAPTEEPPSKPAWIRMAEYLTRPGGGRGVVELELPPHRPATWLLYAWHRLEPALAPDHASAIR